jgi:hypothetical protein
LTALGVRQDKQQQKNQQQTNQQQQQHQHQQQQHKHQKKKNYNIVLIDRKIDHTIKNIKRLKEKKNPTNKDKGEIIKLKKTLGKLKKNKREQDELEKQKAIENGVKNGVFTKKQAEDLSQLRGGGDPELDSYIEIFGNLLIQIQTFIEGSDNVRRWFRENETKMSSDEPADDPPASAGVYTAEDGSDGATNTDSKYENQRKKVIENSKMQEHIKGLRYGYAYLKLITMEVEENMDEQKTSMRKEIFKSLQNIGFGKIKSEKLDKEISKLLNECLEKYLSEHKDPVIDEAYQSLNNSGNEKRWLEFVADFKKSIPLTFERSGIYKDYIRPYYNKNKKGVIIPKDGDEFDTLYDPTPIRDLLFFVNEDKTVDKTKSIIYEVRPEQYEDDEIAEKISENYIDSLMKYVLYAYLIDFIPSHLESKKRETTDININFNDPKTPLLRTFLFFGFLCISTLSNPELIILNSSDLPFWEYLEQNIGNDISISEEVHEGTNFDALVDTGLADQKDKNIAKLIYLLINMRYF